MTALKVNLKYQKSHRTACNKYQNRLKTEHKCIYCRAPVCQRVIFQDGAAVESKPNVVCFKHLKFKRRQYNKRKSTRSK